MEYQVFKFVPYDIFEIDRIAVWLEKQAVKGLFLIRFNRFGFACFRKGSPACIRYQILLTHRGKSTLEEDASPEWTMVYASSNGKVHVFSTNSTKAAPLQADKTALMSSINDIFRMSIISFFILPCILIFTTLFSYQPLYYHESIFVFIYSIFTNKHPLLIILIIMLIIDFFETLYHCVIIYHLKNRIRFGTLFVTEMRHESFRFVISLLLRFLNILIFCIAIISMVLLYKCYF